jgi:hypothetical protein
MSKQLKKGGIKKNKGIYDAGNKGVHCKRYDGHCTKQWVKISKAT